MKNNYLKTGILALFILAGSAVQAQTTDATNSNVDKTAASIKLIDNKGTIKYLQSNNGITSITSTSPGNLTTTTWQLGGALTDDTYIDVSGKAFALDGIELVDNAALAASTDATSLSSHDDTTPGTGWTLLVRDEATGAIKKLNAADLISGIYIEYPQVADAAADVAIPVANLPALNQLSTLAKLFVYRNGVKLRSGTDFVATPGTVTITQSADIPMYAGDFIEIQYIK